MSDIQLGKFEFFPYDKKIQRFLDEFLLTDEERKKHGKNRLEELLKRKLRSNPQNIQRTKAGNLNKVN